jgi:hypothetical protein
VAAIVFAAEHLAGFRQLDVGLEFVEAFDEVPVNRLPRLGPLDEDADVVGAAPQGLAGGQLLFQAAAALQELLSLGGILPEIRMRDAALYLLELRTMARFVKDSSAGRQPV